MVISSFISTASIALYFPGINDFLPNFASIYFLPDQSVQSAIPIVISCKKNSSSVYILSQIYLCIYFFFCQLTVLAIFFRHSQRINIIADKQQRFFIVLFFQITFYSLQELFSLWFVRISGITNNNYFVQ